MNTNKKATFNKAVSTFFKLFFRLLYHEFSWTYDWVAAVVSLGRWKSWTLSVLPYLDNSIVLELGPGPGHLQVALAKKGMPAFGLDASWQMVKQSRNRLNHHSFLSNISRGWSQSMPYASGIFDKVVATFPSEYIVDPDTLEQVWRVLKRDGELIIIPVAWITGKRWWDRLAAGLFRITGQAPDIDPESGDYRDFVSVDFIEKFGFKARKEIIQFHSSKVLLIRAQKPSSDRN
jgi:ubiquinone/menaquinone biosynthesis C-methylase UbiE